MARPARKGVEPATATSEVARNAFAYRTNPVMVEAFQFNGMASLKREHDVPEWFTDAVMTGVIKRSEDHQEPDVVIIQSTDGNMTVRKTDWIVKHEDGGLVALRNKFFAAGYEKPAD